MQAIVNKIIPFSSVDGPGNRTAVFLQGCNLNCKYCHNPETRGLCTHCGICVQSCPNGALYMENEKVKYLPERCIQCDTCIHVCPYGSTPKTKEMTAIEVFEQVSKQIPFIRGITISGGECTMYPEFLTELFGLCKNAGLSTLLDSNGLFNFEEWPELIAVTDGVMLDIKAYDVDQHIQVTGEKNDLILKQAVFLAQIGKLHEVRTVVVPGLFDAEETVGKIGKILAPYLPIHDITYKLIAYRPTGVRKEFQIFEIPKKERLNNLLLLLKEEGFQNIITI